MNANERESAVFRCKKCSLVQHLTARRRCCACFYPLPTLAAPTLHLRAWRALRGMTQQQVATIAGIGRVHYGRIERGRSAPCPQRTLPRLAAALRIPTALLFAPPSGDLAEMARLADRLTPAHRSAVLDRVIARLRAGWEAA